MDRTDRTLLWLIRILVVPGLLAATYLTYSKLAGVEPVCSTGGCGKVNQSTWSEVLGIPVTLVGMITYVLIFASTFVRTDLGRIGAALLATMGAAFSIFLQYQALVVLGLTCQYCLVSAACMILLAGLTIARLLRLPPTGDVDAGAPAST